MLRKSLVVLSMIAVGAFAQGCGNDCDAAADDIEAKATECGLDTTDGGDTDDAVECTDELAATMQCQAACFTAAPCEAFDGSDPDAALEFSECIGGC